MIGEIRDKETADMAVAGRADRHWFLDAAHQRRCVFRRATIGAGVPNYLVNATLVGILAQRLIRTLCPHAKRSGSDRPRAMERAGPSVALEHS